MGIGAAQGGTGWPTRTFERSYTYPATNNAPHYPAPNYTLTYTHTHAHTHTRTQGVDMAFLAAAFSVSLHTVYSLHKSSTRDFIAKTAKRWGRGGGGGGGGGEEEGRRGGGGGEEGRGGREGAEGGTTVREPGLRREGRKAGESKAPGGQGGARERLHELQGGVGVGGGARVG